MRTRRKDIFKKDIFKKGLLFVLTFAVLGGWLFPKLKVVATYRYIGDLTEKIGGDTVSVFTMAKGYRDPHFITPKPSFIARMRRAKLLIINGGQLEIGWLPPVLKQSNNNAVNPGGKGFLSLIDFVKPIDAHRDVSRAHGDVHPEGNPHIQLDPAHIPLFAQAIADKLCELEPGHCETYKKNLLDFKTGWKRKMAEWQAAMEPLKGIHVVEYHKLYSYLFHRFGIESVATLEPLPGIPPTTRHVSGVIELIKKENIGMILQDVYHNSKTAKFVSRRSGAQVKIIPHDVGAVKEADDIFSLFNEIVRRLTSK
jgi:zinc/manganese transport system substrate-binding protein